MSNQARPASVSPEEWAATPASVRAGLAELTRQLQQLQERTGNLEQRLNQNSGNSSQPPALDRKANRPKPARRRHRGAKTGHVKMERVWVEKPDQVIEAALTSCTHCQADASSPSRQLLSRAVGTEAGSPFRPTVRLSQDQRQKSF